MYRFGPNATPKDIGLYVAEQFEGGALHVHLQDVPFAHLEDAAQEAYIREASSFIGPLTLSTAEPTSDVWRLDSAASPSSSRIPYHTDNPFYEKPEKYVGFWNVKSSAAGGENVLLPLRTILEETPQFGVIAGILKIAQARQVTFQHGKNRATGNIIDADKDLIRFDARYIDEHNTGLASILTSLLEGQALTGTSLKLAEGDVLFFDNHRLLHARQPYSDAGRVNIRVRIGDTTAA